MCDCTECICLRLTLLLLYWIFKKSCLITLQIGLWYHNNNINQANPDEYKEQVIDQKNNKISTTSILRFQELRKRGSSIKIMCIIFHLFRTSILFAKNKSYYNTIKVQRNICSMTQRIMEKKRAKKRSSEKEVHT